MRKMGIFCRVRMRKYNSYKGDVGRIAPNLLERDFKTDKPNQKLVTDVTEFALFGIKLYLSPIIDLYNGEVVSYNLSRHPNLVQTTDMLEKAFRRFPETVLELEQTKIRLQNTESGLRQALCKISSLEQSMASMLKKEGGEDA